MCDVSAFLKYFLVQLILLNIIYNQQTSKIQQMHCPNNCGHSYKETYRKKKS